MSTLVRAQLKSDAGTWEMLYASESPAVISTIRLCNVGSQREKASVRIALESTEYVDLAQYILYEVPVFPGFPYAVTEGLTLAAADAVWVMSSGGQVAFSIYGQERD